MHFVGNASIEIPISFISLNIYNDFIPVHTIVESRDAIFDETDFPSTSKPKDLLNSNIEACDRHQDRKTTLRKLRSKRAKKKSKLFGLDFYVYLVEGSRESIMAQT